MLSPEVPVMARKKKTTPRFDDREVIIVLKDTPEYRDWFIGLSEATLIRGATIVRDALAKWAADRGLPGPPSGPTRTMGPTRKPRPKRPKGNE